MDTAGGSRDEQRTYAEGSAFVLALARLAPVRVEQVDSTWGKLVCNRPQARYAVVA